MLWPGHAEREYRISQGHDAAAALAVDGTIVAAAAEERFDRRKHSQEFPLGATQYCLRHARLGLDEIDLIVHSSDYGPYRFAYSLDPRRAVMYRQALAPEVVTVQVEEHLPGFPADRVCCINHQMAHAASAYYTSGWDDCLVIVVDAIGEKQSASVYCGCYGELRKLAGMSVLDSIGILYSLVTFHLGFDFNSDECKIMGLAPYGDPNRFRRFFEAEVRLLADGTVRIPLLRLNDTCAQREFYAGTRQYLTHHLIPARHPGEEITDVHRDVAAGLQQCLDKVMLHICGHFAHATGLRRLALAGRVALNCTANGQLNRAGIFDEIYVQPATGDEGAALGAALFWAAKTAEVPGCRLPTPFLGPSYSRDEIENALAECGDRIDIYPYQSLSETCPAAARAIADGLAVAWYRGRMEFGPRALGNRSIVGHPGRPDMRERINAMVKKQTAFRPFAAAVSIEQVHLWFDVPVGTELPYMITEVNVCKESREQLPAVTHVDGSARVQTVSAWDNPAFHALLEAVGQVTGKKMVLTTNFSVNGQPIVNTPREAIETFLATEIDCLFLEDFLVERKRPPTD